MKNLKGGYQMIDCQGLDLTKGTAQTITGIYEELTQAIATGKPVYAYNCIWGAGKPVTPMNVLCLQLDSTTITATASTLQINVKNNDKCTVGNLVSNS